MTARMSTKYFLDMDGTLAEWKPGKENELLSDGYFRDLKPTAFLIPFRKFAKEHSEQIFILSHYIPSGHIKEDKNNWLDEFFPEVPRSQRLFIPCEVTKSEFIKEHFHVNELPSHWVLFDDYSKNLHAWKHAGGTGLKCYNGINGNHGTWKGDSVMWSPDVETFLRDHEFQNESA